MNQNRAHQPTDGNKTVKAGYATAITNLSTTIFGPDTGTYNLRTAHNSSNELVYLWPPTISIFSQRLSNNKLAMFRQRRTMPTRVLLLRFGYGVKTGKISFADKENNNNQQQSPTNLIFF